MMLGLLILLYFTACIVSSVSFGIPLSLGFLMGLIGIFAAVTFKTKAPKQYLKVILDGVIGGRKLYFIVGLMGINISMWLSSGVVAKLIDSGLDLVVGVNYLSTIFLFTLILAFLMGTALGTLSTIGLALIGIGVGIGIPKEILIGTVISGSYIADRLSPISGLVNLSLTITRTTYKAYFKESLKTMIPTIIIVFFIYFLINDHYSAQVSPESVKMIQEALRATFDLNGILLMIPIIMVVMAAFGIDILWCMGGTILLSAGALLFLQGTGPLQILNYMWCGFNDGTSSELVNGLIRGGGLKNMMEIIVIIMMALSLSHILQVSGILEPLFTGITKKIKTSLGVDLGVFFSSILFTSVSCDQSLGILMPPMIFQEKAESLNYSPVKMARIIGDSGTIVAPLEFWNLNSLVIFSVTGIAATQYFAYAYLCMVLPVITLFKILLDSRRKHETL